MSQFTNFPIETSIRSLSKGQFQRIVCALFLCSIIIAELPYSASAYPSSVWELQDIINAPYRFRERRSLASGRWGLRPGKRSNLRPLSGIDSFSDMGPADNTLSWIFLRDLPRLNKFEDDAYVI